MGIDLSGVLGVLGAGAAGASRGLGNYSQIQFAERLRQAAEGRQFDRQRQLADESFGREKELREFIANLTRESGIESDRSDLVNQAEQALGVAQGQGMSGISKVDTGSMGPEDLNNFIGQMAAASDLIKRAGVEREEAPERQEEAVLARSLIDQRAASARASDALVTQRNAPDTPPSGSDGVMSDAQIQQVNMAILKAEDDKRESIAKEIKDIKSLMNDRAIRSNPGHMEALEKELEELQENVDIEVKKAGDRYRGLLGGGGDRIQILLDKVKSGVTD